MGIACCMQLSAVENPVDYVNTLVGTQSKYELSTGNTYPATAMPWGMNFWTPQTGEMGNGWTYRYDADKIRGFKQTHQPKAWSSTRRNGLAGSLTKAKWLHLIIIRSIWPIMT